MAAKRRFTRERRERFLDCLRETGNVTEAARKAGISRSAAYDARAADPSFALKWRDAAHSISDRLTAEAVRRALEGVEEPYYYQGEERGTVRKFNDALLMFLLKMCNPEIFTEDEGPAGAAGVEEGSGVVFQLNLGGPPATGEENEKPRTDTREEPAGG